MNTLTKSVSERLNTIEIRLIKPADAVSLHRLICELAQHQGHLDSVRVTPEMLKTQLESANCPFECLIAENGSEAIGFALYFQTYSTWEGKPGLYLEDVYVVPEWRSDGIGRLLLKRLCEISLERGYPRIDWVVMESNPSASLFYRKLGAKPMADWNHWRFSQHDIERMVSSLDVMKSR